MSNFELYEGVDAHIYENGKAIEVYGSNGGGMIYYGESPKEFRYRIYDSRNRIVVEYTEKGIEPPTDDLDGRVVEIDGKPYRLILQDELPF